MGSDVGNILVPDQGIDAVTLTGSSEAGVSVTKASAEKLHHVMLELGGHRDGAFFEMTVLIDVTSDMDIAKDMEVFGPVFPIIGFDTKEEAVEIANASKYGLGGGAV